MSNRIIQFTQLGKFGRFGNQIFQYLFARAYAEANDATLEVPSWIGQKIFKNVNHPTPSVRLRTTKLDEFPNGINIDIHGYCQKKEFIDILSEAKIREWLQFQDKWLEYFKDLKSITVAHIRRGDYLTLYSNIFCVISKKSYYDACDKFEIPRMYSDIVWKSEEEPVQWKGLNNDLSFLPDFFEMIQSQYLLRANSTFSFWAGFFNTTGKVYSPIVEGRLGECDVEFVEGNHPKIIGSNPDTIFKE